MSLQLTGNTWELKLDSIFDANAIQHLLGTFTNPFVVINITSDDVLPVWQQAGSIGQAIPFEDSFAYGEVKLVTLNDYLLLQFPLLTGTNYQLYYFPLPRLVSAKVKIWEYQGETVNTTINELADGLKNIDFTSRKNNKLSPLLGFY